MITGFVLLGAEQFEHVLSFAIDSRTLAVLRGGSQVLKQACLNLRAGVGSIPLLVLGDLEDVLCMDIVNDARRGLTIEVEDGDLWEELFKEPKQQAMNFEEGGSVWLPLHTTSKQCEALFPAWECRNSRSRRCDRIRGSRFGSRHWHPLS